MRTVTFASSPPTGTSGSAGFGMRSRRSSSSASARQPRRRWRDPARRRSRIAPARRPRGRPGVAPPGSPRRSASMPALRSALSASDSAWSRRRAASTSSARSTSAGSSPLSIAPLRMRSGSSRSRCTPTLMPGASSVPRRPARLGRRRMTNVTLEARQQPAGAGRWAGRGTRGTGPRTPPWRRRRGRAATAKIAACQARRSSRRVAVGGLGQRAEECPALGPAGDPGLDRQRRADLDRARSGRKPPASRGRRRAARRGSPARRPSRARPSRRDRSDGRRRRGPGPAARGGERRPEGPPRPPRRPRRGRAASSGRSRSKPGGSSPLTSRPAVAAASRSNSSNRRGIASPSGSNSMAPFGRWRTNRKRSCSGGSTSAIAWAAPRPFEVDIFLPPMFRNSYGTLSGGSRSNTSRAIASLRSRDPPAVARSLPQLDRHAEQPPLRRPLEVPRQLRGAAERRDPARPAAARRPRHEVGLHATATVSPSQSVASVVPTLPQFGQMTPTGSHAAGAGRSRRAGRPRGRRRRLVERVRMNGSISPVG